MDQEEWVNMDIEAEIQKLKDEVSILRQRRISQSDYLPQSIKQRHIGEAPAYVNAGLAANLPTIGAKVTSSTSVYYATDTDVLYIWDGIQWKAH